MIDLANDLTTDLPTDLTNDSPLTSPTTSPMTSPTISGRLQALGQGPSGPDRGPGRLRKENPRFSFATPAGIADPYVAKRCPGPCSFRFESVNSVFSDLSGGK